MLLELFIQFAGGARVSTKCLVIASGAPDTTALRMIDRLVESGLVERAPSQTDKRVTLINLTREGVVAVGMVLTEAEA
jgi:DNA-binding IclR family transcriptional regulator